MRAVRAQAHLVLQDELVVGEALLRTVLRELQAQDSETSSEKPRKPKRETNHGRKK